MTIQSAAASQNTETEGKPVAQGESPKLRHKAFGGGDNDSWNCGVANRMAGALPAFHSPDFAEAARACLQGLRGVKPNDPIEGMLASQIIAAHEAAMHLRRLAWHPDQSFVVQTRYLELAEKAARTMAMLTERLDQHRSRGQQQITVRHVNVNADQALVAGSITTSESQKSSPTRPAGELLTTGGQRAMEMLESNVVGMGVRRKYDHRPHAKRP
jgi:hypothetical protein